MVQITKIGAGLIALVLLVGFVLVGVGEVYTTQTVKNYQPVVITKTVVVTPTAVPVAPTATPAATIKVVRPLTK